MLESTMNMRRLYSIARYKTQIESKASNPRSKSLGEELAVLRMALETVMNSLTDDSELIAKTPVISDLIDKIAKLATGAQRLDMATGETLDKTQLAIFADRLTKIVAETEMPTDSRIKLQTGITDLAKQLFSNGLDEEKITAPEVSQATIDERIKQMDLDYANENGDGEEPSAGM